MIKIQNLSKHFGHLKAVDDLTMDIQRGEIVSLLGPNGAGKTTTMRMLSAIIAPSSGSIMIDNTDLEKNSDAVRSKIGLLTESPGFYERFSGEYNLLYFINFYEKSDSGQLVEKYLKRVGLYNRKDDAVGTYSKGMKQRLAIARALAHEPDILLLDEPTAGLDPQSARDIRSLIEELKDDNRTILLSTHNLSEAEQLSDRVAFFNTTLKTIDSLGNIRARFESSIIAECSNISDSMIEEINSLENVDDVETTKDRIIIHYSGQSPDKSGISSIIVSNNGKLNSIYQIEKDMEDIYLSIIGEIDEQK